MLKTELMDRAPLLDEIAVIDSGSTDRTREVASEYGAVVHSSAGILKKYGSHRGKGENLWKSLYVLDGRHHRVDRRGHHQHRPEVRVRPGGSSAGRPGHLVREGLL